MSIMECGHCLRPCDSRGMHLCGQCERAICDECLKSGDCPGREAQDERIL